MSVAPSDGSQGPPEDPFDETSDVPAEAGGTSESIVTKYWGRHAQEQCRTPLSCDILAYLRPVRKIGFISIFNYFRYLFICRVLHFCDQKAY